MKAPGFASGVLAQDSENFGHPLLARRGSGRRYDFHFQAAGHHLEEYPVQCLSYRGKLLGNVFTGRLLLHHAKHPANLALGASKSHFDTALVGLANMFAGYFARDARGLRFGRCLGGRALCWSGHGGRMPFSAAVRDGGTSIASGRATRIVPQQRLRFGNLSPLGRTFHGVA